MASPTSESVHPIVTSDMSKTSETCSPEIELQYFPIRVRAEPIRMAMTIAGIPFKNVTANAGELKLKSPYGYLPVLVYKGKRYGESKAIASFVARLCGMAGETSEDALRVDEVYCLTSTFLGHLGKAVHESDDQKKKELEETLENETIPQFLGFYERLLRETKDGYFVASSLSLADLTVYDVTCSLLNLNPKVLDDFPQIQKMRKNLNANPKVCACVAARPYTDY